MQDEMRNCGCNDNCGCGNNTGLLGGLLGRNGCGCGCNTEILFFLIIFLLLFTDFGCGCRR